MKTRHTLVGLPPPLLYRESIHTYTSCRYMAVESLGSETARNGGR